MYSTDHDSLTTEQLHLLPKQDMFEHDSEERKVLRTLIGTHG